MTTIIEILSKEEIRAITGASWRKQQIAWLQNRMWPHEVNALGFPIVLRSVALDRLGADQEPEVWTLDESNIN